MYLPCVVCIRLVVTQKSFAKCWRVTFGGAKQSVTAIFVEGSADHLPFPDASFGVVLCTLMLHHLPAQMQAAAIVEMRRILRPGGRIVIVDLQQPRKISGLSFLALVHIFYKGRSQGTAPDWQKIEELLTQQGVALVGRHAIWGETVSGLVGRVAL
jgi:ubiquinone/menaquinone biosynthesis C-methylase UbiE